MESTLQREHNSKTDPIIVVLRVRSQQGKIPVYDVLPEPARWVTMKDASAWEAVFVNGQYRYSRRDVVDLHSRGYAP